MLLNLTSSEIDKAITEYIRYHTLNADTVITDINYTALRKSGKVIASVQIQEPTTQAIPVEAREVVEDVDSVPTSPSKLNNPLIGLDDSDIEEDLDEIFDN